MIGVERDFDRTPFEHQRRALSARDRAKNGRIECSLIEADRALVDAAMKKHARDPGPLAHFARLCSTHQCGLDDQASHAPG